MKKDVIITITDRLEKILKKGKGKRSRTLKIFAIFFLILICNIKRCLFFKSVLSFHFILLIRLRHNYNTTKNISIKCFHMTSRRPCWCSKTMKRRPCWCPKPVLWELNSFLSFVPIKSHTCWQREWKRSIKPGFHYRISRSTYVSKWKLGRHKHEHKHKKNGQIRSSCACAYAYVVALTSENGINISTSIRTRTWTNHRSLWPPTSWEHIKSNMADETSTCLSSRWGELVSRIESIMPFCACVCPCAYAYALVKNRRKDLLTK